MGLLTMDDGIVNWGEHTEDEETQYIALMAYRLVVMANEIYEKDEKNKKYRRIRMKDVKEKEQLQKTLDTWKDSSKNLWRLINSGMSSSSKFGLGFRDLLGTSLKHSVDLESRFQEYLKKYCDYYEKKMAREAAPKKQRVFNTGNGVTKPVWNNADRINHANHFVPRSVILNSDQVSDKEKRSREDRVKEFASTGLDFEEVKSAFEKVNTGGIRVSVPSPDRGRREGKAPMTEEEETQASRKTKEQILQEEAGLAEAIRLDALEKALEKEEVAKQVHLDSLIAQRMG
ncbi:hypothetical protein Tco_0344780 [Tanacetum coccineum]